MDPSYLWFRNVTQLSSTQKMFFRILIILPPTFHCAMTMLGASVIIVNMLLALVSKLKKLRVRAKNVNSTSKIGDIVEYASCMRAYRQLQIIILHMNQFLYYIFPVTLITQFCVVTLSSYAVIKMLGQVSHAIISSPCVA